MLNEQEEKELNALIEEEKKILEFYVRYKKSIEKMTSNREWEIEVNECLDRLFNYCRLLKE